MKQSAAAAMERKPRGNLPRSHSGGGSESAVVTHRTHAIARSATLPEHDAHTAPPSSSPPLYATRPSSSSSSDPRFTVASTRGALHSPAVWLFEDFVPARERAVAVDLGEGETDGEEEREESAALHGRAKSAHHRHRRHPHNRARNPADVSRPWMVEAIELQPDATTEAPSPRVLDNRLYPRNRDSTSLYSRPSLSQPSIEEIAATSIPSHAAFVSAPPEEVTEDQRSASGASSLSVQSPSQTDTRTKTWVSATSARDRNAERYRRDSNQQQASPSASSSSSSSSASSSPPSARSTRIDRPPPLPQQHQHDSTSMWLSTPAARHSSSHRRHHRHRRSPPSPPRSSAEASATSSPSAFPDNHHKRSRSAKEASKGSGAAPQHPASSPAGKSSSSSAVFVDGVGPLMVVHLDVLPMFSHEKGRDATNTPTASSASLVGGRGSSALIAASDDGVQNARLVPTFLPDGDALSPESTAAALQALVSYEAAEAHTSEVAALHARLEVAEQRARLAEQQVAAAAEVRAAALVADYKVDERRRRSQFQSTLDALREENRDLTARLEAAVRAPAVGLHPSSAISTATATTAVAPSALTRVDGALVAGAAPTSTEVEVARQVHAVEAYWRERLRTAERHWEEEMTRQSQQRREALDQVEELVRTVEQSQEELRYTRRQAARLREENVRLSSAATSAASSRVLPNSAVAALSAEEVERLRRAVKAHEHREAALLAQVESYGEEATQVRLRYEAALERAQQDVAAERRRSTEMVKLYGSQLESLHHQLREAKEAKASR